MKTTRPLLILLLILLSACQAKNASDPNATMPAQINKESNSQTEDVHQSKHEKYNLIFEEKIVWTKDNAPDAVKILARNDDRLHIKVMSGFGEKSIELDEYGFPERVEIFPLDMKGSQALLLKINYYQPEEKTETIIDERWAVLVLGQKDGKINPLFQTMNLPVNLNHNYNVEYNIDVGFKILDKSTGFTVNFVPTYDDEYRTYLNQAIQKTEFERAFEPSAWFAQVDLVPATENENSMIRLTKVIPGLKRDYPVGFFEYEYTWDLNQYRLSKEKFYTAEGVFLLNPKKIQEMKFDTN